MKGKTIRISSAGAEKQIREIRDKKLAEIAEGNAKKSEDDKVGLRPEELALPPKAADPHNMAFSDSELDALCDVSSEEAKALALATATPAKRALLKPKGKE